MEETRRSKISTEINEGKIERSKRGKQKNKRGEKRNAGDKERQKEGRERK